MKLLLFLTNTFPYGDGEDFISAELEQADGFDRIIVCPCSRKPDVKQTKVLPQGVQCIPVTRKPMSAKSVYPKLLLRSCVWDELFRLFRTKRFQTQRAHELLFFMKNAVEMYEGLKQVVSVQPSDSVVIYSYWLYDAAAAGALLAADLRNKGVKVRQISRAHGFDIHPERSQYNYLPMRTFLFRSLDCIYPCSNDGVGVLKSTCPQYQGKVQRSYLGTKDCGVGQQNRNPFHLVSCSYMVTVKRLHLIAEALQETNFPILWTHIGGGPLEDEIRGLTKTFPSQVKAEFLGQCENSEILNYYKTTPISVFVNVSSSEGIPVSIMEACSFGIPVVATDVGGTHELVANGQNGFLISKDFTPQTLLDILRRIQSMEEAEYDSLCANARNIWEEKFNAQQNYRRFYEEISK